MPVLLSSINLSNTVGQVSSGPISPNSSSNITVEEPKKFERFSKQFINSEPKILFISEYIVNDKFSGTLLVWEKFFNATHYEVFKRNIFSTNSKFERILFLDSKSLDEEKNYYVNYINNILGFSSLNMENVYVMLDSITKEDRIYEYKIKASFVPQKAADVEYDSILEGKDLLRKVEASIQNIFQLSSAILLNEDLAWVVSLCNMELGFFGKTFSKTPINKIIKDMPGKIFLPVEIFVPKDIDSIIKMFNDSVILFGLKESFKHMLNFLRGLTNDVISIAINSIDENKGTFSFDLFRESIKDISPATKLVFSISSSEKIEQLAKLGIVIPKDTGSLSLFSMETLTKIFRYINEMIISLSYSQDNFKAVEDIIAGVVSQEQQQNAVVSTQTTAQTQQGTSSGTAVSTVSSTTATAVKAVKL